MCGEIGYGTKNSNGLFEGLVAQIIGGWAVCPKSGLRSVSAELLFPPLFYGTEKAKADKEIEL